jgi:hypothetical protein
VMREGPDMTLPQTETTADKLARLKAKLHAGRPDAIEADIVPICRPGAIAFVDGRYGGVSDSIDEVWPHAERWLQWFADLLPVRHRVEYWRERMEAGAMILTAFFESQTWHCVGAGFINCELSGDNKPIVFAPANTLRDVNLSDLARIAESVALRTEADAVHLWTAEPWPVVPGYQAQACFFGQLQVAPVRPIQ